MASLSLRCRRESRSCAKRLGGASGLVLAVALAALLVPSGAGAASPPVIPPVGHVYDGLSAAWWKWVEAQPASTSPLTDTSGERCAVGQSGPVFYLVGSTSSEKVIRDRCRVRFGRALFFPLVNAFDVHVPNDGLDTPRKVWDDLQITLGWRVDSVRASVDGSPIAITPTGPFRACVGPVAPCLRPSFSLTFPADNFFGLAAGTYAPAVADGVYLLLGPLAPGTHTITFGGTGQFNGAPFSQDITYHLRVVL
jgi:hypothetical protein